MQVDTNAGIVTSKISGLNAMIDGGLGNLKMRLVFLMLIVWLIIAVVVDDFVKGFSDAFEDEMTNTGANTNATYLILIKSMDYQQ